jgi:large subunit ribosomal protein L14
MKGLGSRITKGLTTSSVLLCADNSGAKLVMIIGVGRYKGGRGIYPKAGVCDIIIAAVKKGSPEMKKKVVKAVVVRQRKEFRRANGVRIQFEDNAAVLIDEDGLPVGTEIKGAVCREIAERFPRVAAIAAAVV